MITITEYRAMLKKKPKFKNIKAATEGLKFDSKKEANRYIHLFRLRELGAISDLMHHEKFPLIVNGVKIGYYESDFTYYRDGIKVVEDVKSAHTRTLPVYRLKKKLMAAIYGITIIET